MGVTYNDYWLAHHGIEGQKWGVQNGPPYPLDKKTSIKVKKNASNNATTSLSEGTFMKLWADSVESWKKYCDPIFDRYIDDVLNSDAYWEAYGRDAKTGGHESDDLYEKACNKAHNEVAKLVRRDMVKKYGEELIDQASEANRTHKYSEHTIEFGFDKKSSHVKGKILG